MKDNELSHAGELAGASVQCPANPPQRILVVDDDSDLRLLYAEVLARPGYHVDAAKDGAAGWEALQVNNYNLLITEHSLPKLTGVDLVKRSCVPPAWPCRSSWPR
jgi:CheY-like chemotaxis protein